MATEDHFSTVQSMYIAYYGRPADVGGLIFWSEKLENEYPARDWILTRIMWLSGLQVGFNRSGTQDTMRRYVYIHGCPENIPMGLPDSHGCIRMRNSEVIQLFAMVEAGIPVFIDEKSINENSLDEGCLVEEKER